MNDKNILARRILDFATAPISSVFVERDVVGHISKMFFVRRDGKCLSLYNEMVELSERLEEGCLMADLCDQPTGQQIILKSDQEIDRESLQLLTFDKNGNLHPSGVVFKFLSEDRENYIVVGAAPFTLVFFSTLYSESKAPEYDLSDYKKEYIA